MKIRTVRTQVNGSIHVTFEDGSFKIFTSTKRLLAYQKRNAEILVIEEAEFEASRKRRETRAAKIEAELAARGGK